MEMYVINLASRPERWKQMQQSFPEFNLKRVEAVDASLQGITVIEAIKLSHLQLLESFKLIDAPYFIVAEDDICKTEHYEMYWTRVVDFITHSEGWDMIALDGFFYWDNWITTLTRMNRFSYKHPGLVKIDKFRNLGCVVYSKDCIDRLCASKYLKIPLPIDMTLSCDSTFIKYTPAQHIIHQPPGFSNNTNIFIDHSVMYSKNDQFMNQVGKESNTVLYLLTAIVYVLVSIYILRTTL